MKTRGCMEKIMRQVTGWLTLDEKFFVLREEAELHEDTEMLRAALIQFAGPKADFGRFIFVIANLKHEVRSYLNAAQALEDYENRKSEDTDDGQGVEPNQDDLGIGEVDEADEQQPAGGPDAVSNMGTRSLAEEIRNIGEGDGVRGWGAYAQGVQHGSHLAAMAAPEVGEARHGNGGATVWEQVDAHLESIRGAQERGPSGSPASHVLRDIAQRGMGRQPDRRHEDDE